MGELTNPLTVGRERGVIGDLVPVATHSRSPVGCHGLLDDGDGFIDWAASWATPDDRVIVPLVRRRIG